MKTYNEFLIEAMESASSIKMQVSCTADEFNKSLKNINWLSGEINDGVASFFGPKSDIDRWIKKNSHWVI